VSGATKASQHRLQADGQGALPPPEGILPRKRIRFLAFSRQIPRPPLKLAVEIVEKVLFF